MDNVSVPNPNPFVTQWLKGPECKKLVTQKANKALAIYRGIVAKRTGALAASGHVVTRLGGLSNDRWEARLIADAPHAASHEFGTGRTNPGRALPAAHDMDKVIDAMDFR